MLKRKNIVIRAKIGNRDINNMISGGFDRKYCGREPLPTGSWQLIVACPRLAALAELCGPIDGLSSFLVRYCLGVIGFENQIEINFLEI